MQDDFSSLSSKRLQFGSLSQNDAIVEAREFVADRLILNPTMPANRLAALLADTTEPELSARLLPILLAKFYRRIIAANRKAAPLLQDPLPGFAHLPQTIPTREGGTLALLDANYRRLRDYYRSLTRVYATKQSADMKIREARALLEKLRPYAAKEERITVRQVLMLEEEDI